MPSNAPNDRDPLGIAVLMLKALKIDSHITDWRRVLVIKHGRQKFDVRVRIDDDGNVRVRQRARHSVIYPECEAPSASRLLLIIGEYAQKRAAFSHAEARPAWRNLHNRMCGL